MRCSRLKSVWMQRRMMSLNLTPPTWGALGHHQYQLPTSQMPISQMSLNLTPSTWGTLGHPRPTIIYCPSSQPFEHNSNNNQTWNFTRTRFPKKHVNRTNYCKNMRMQDVFSHFLQFFGGGQNFSQIHTHSSYFLKTK